MPTTTEFPLKSTVSSRAILKGEYGTLRENPEMYYQAERAATLLGIDKRHVESTDNDNCPIDVAGLIDDLKGTVVTDKHDDLRRVEVGELAGKKIVIMELSDVCSGLRTPADILLFLFQNQGESFHAAVANFFYIFGKKLQPLYLACPGCPCASDVAKF